MSNMITIRQHAFESMGSNYGKNMGAGPLLSVGILLVRNTLALWGAII